MKVLILFKSNGQHLLKIVFPTFEMNQCPCLIMENNNVSVVSIKLIVKRKTLEYGLSYNTAININYWYY